MIYRDQGAPRATRHPAMRGSAGLGARCEAQCGVGRGAWRCARCGALLRCGVAMRRARLWVPSAWRRAGRSAGGRRGRRSVFTASACSRRPHPPPAAAAPLAIRPHGSLVRPIARRPAAGATGRGVWPASTADAPAYPGRARPWEPARQHGRPTSHPRS